MADRVNKNPSLTFANMNRAPLSSKLLSYEDPHVLREINRKMAEDIAKAEAAGIDIRHDYHNRHWPTQRGKDHKPSRGSWRAAVGNPRKFGSTTYLDDVYANVPRTPSLANYAVMQEELSHAEELDRLGKINRDHWLLDKGVSPGRLNEERRAKADALKRSGGYYTPEVADFMDWTAEGYEKGHGRWKKAKERKALSEAANKLLSEPKDTGGK